MYPPKKYKYKIFITAKDPSFPFVFSLLLLHLPGNFFFYGNDLIFKILLKNAFYRREGIYVYLKLIHIVV